MSINPIPQDSLRRALARLVSVYKPAPAVPLVTNDPAQLSALHRAWQIRVLVAAILGYATFYLLRKNLSMAMPVMERDLGIAKSDLGLFLTLHGLLYGVSKLINGVIGDHSHARTFMVTGLVLSALVNVCFGLSTGTLAFGVLWMLNGWFQGMGYPPCGRLMAHWIPPNELATKMSIWNASTNIGAGAVVIICGYLISAFGDWRLCFFAPASVALVCALGLWFALPDTPQSVGLPEVKGTQLKATERTAADWKTILVRHVLTNPWIWLLGIANFFIYSIRFAVLDWGPTFLSQQKHLELKHAGWIVAGYEISGMCGAMLGGWLTDRLFGGRCFRSCVFYMALTGVAVFIFWKVAGNSFGLNAALLCVTGFFVYGPQCLLGIAAANLATKRAAASAVGLVGLFGYLSTTLSGWGLGKLVQTYGWDAGFAGMIIVAGLGTATCLIGWNAKPHGYEPESAGATAPNRAPHRAGAPD
ncbi:MAG: MFS transporter [Verrucomicrobiae bacterium]|nr:MFS transporter [Verrucomicrobiae bacterium]